MAEVQTRMENIRQHRISTNNVYQFLLYFDKLYGQFTDLEKKTFMNSFIERVEIFPERQSDGRIIKRIEFRFPVYIQGAERTALSWDKPDMSETVMLLVQQRPDDIVRVGIDTGRAQRHQCREQSHLWRNPGARQGADRPERHAPVHRAGEAQAWHHRARVQQQGQGRKSEDAPLPARQGGGD